MQGINTTFHVIRQMLKSTVPGYLIMTNEDAHYHKKRFSEKSYRTTEINWT